MKNIVMEDKGRFLLILTLISVSVFYLCTIRSGHDWGGDFAQYFEHARNIAEGNDYGHTAYIKNPNRLLAPDVYPPGLPLFISIIYAIDGFNLTAIKVMSCLFFFGSLIFFTFIFRARMSDYYVAAVVGITALYPRFWEYKDMTFSEFPFIFFVLSTLFLTEKTFDGKIREKWKTVLLYCGIMLFLIMATATRVIGGILIPVIIVYFFQKIGSLKYFFIGSLGALLIMVLLFMEFYDLFEGLASYLSLIKFNPKLIFVNLERYVSYFCHFWNNYNPFILNQIFSIILFLFSIAGFYFSCREKVTIYDIFFLFYFGFLLIVPWPLNRFLLPLYPFYVYYTIVGINRVIKLKTPQYNYAIKAVLLIFIIQVFIAKYRQYDFDSMQPGIGSPDAVELFEYINEETNDSSVIVFRKPRVISLFTKRKSLVYQRQTNKKLAAYFNQQGVTHLIIGKFYDDYDYINDFWETYENRFSLELTNSEFRVYRVLKPL